MYKLVRREKSFKYSVLAEEDTLKAILDFLIYNGYLEKFDYSKEYIENVVNGCTDNIRQYLADTLMNFGANLLSENIIGSTLADYVDAILTNKATIYFSDTGDTCIVLDSFDYINQLKDLNKFLSIYGVMLIEEIKEV